MKEECDEVIDSKNTFELFEELADLLEVIKSIANKTIDDIIEIANQKRLKWGGFEKRIFLEKTLSDKNM